MAKQLFERIYLQGILQSLVAIKYTTMKYISMLHIYLFSGPSVFQPRQKEKRRYYSSTAIPRYNLLEICTHFVNYMQEFKLRPGLWRPVLVKINIIKWHHK